MNTLRKIRTAAELFIWWPFFAEGLEQLNSPSGGRGKINDSTFAKVLVHIVTGSERDGVVMLLKSKNEKPLGFVALTDCTPPFGQRAALVYAVYSSGKCPTAIRELNEYVMRWANEFGYEELQACSFRMTGAAVRWFGRQGFKPRCFLFSKKVQ